MSFDDPFQPKLSYDSKIRRTRELTLGEWDISQVWCKLLLKIVILLHPANLEVKSAKPKPVIAVKYG